MPGVLRAWPLSPEGCFCYVKLSWFQQASLRVKGLMELEQGLVKLIWFKRAFFVSKKGFYGRGSRISTGGGYFKAKGAYEVLAL